MSYQEKSHGRITLPDIIKTTDNMENFLSSVYPAADLCLAPNDPDIVLFSAPGISFVHETNDLLLDRTPGTVHTLYAADGCVVDDEDFADASNVTPEVLDSINASGPPLSHLRVKVKGHFFLFVSFSLLTTLQVGAPVIILRNLDPPNGLCDGTRCTILHIYRLGRFSGAFTVYAYA
jgi:hypothetical protein